MCTVYNLHADVCTCRGLVSVPHLLSQEAGPNGRVVHTISETRIGPLFNLGVPAGERHVAGSGCDLIDMLDLKLGLYQQQQPTDLGANTL